MKISVGFSGIFLMIVSMWIEAAPQINDGDDEAPVIIGGPCPIIGEAYVNMVSASLFRPNKVEGQIGCWDDEKNSFIYQTKNGKIKTIKYKVVKEVRHRKEEKSVYPELDEIMTGAESN